MGIDVTAEVHIARPRIAVANYAMNPEHDPLWIGGISAARLLTPPPVGVGTRAARVASFLGKRIDYVLEVTAHDPHARLVMQTVQGPFPMHVTYSFADAQDGTRAAIRVAGDAGGFYRVAAPLLALMVRRNISRDLAALKRIMESGAAS